MQGLGDMPGAKAPLLRSLELLGRPVPSSGLGIGFGIFRATFVQMWQRLRPASSSPSGPDALRWVEAARAYDRLQRTFYFGGEYGRLLFANLSTLNLPKVGMPVRELVVAYSNIGATAGVIPLPRVCDYYFGLCDATIARGYDLEADTYRLNARAIYLLGIGRWSEAFRACQTSAEAALAARYSRRYEESAGVCALVAIAEGDLELAWDWNERALASAESRGDPQMLSWGWLNRLLLQLSRADLDSALATHDDLSGILDKISRPERVAALCLQGALQWRLGHHPRALDSIRSGLELAAVERSLSPIFEPYSHAAHVLTEALAQSSEAELRRQLKATCRILARIARAFPIAFPRYALHEGQRLWGEGRQARARGLWSQGLGRARELGMAREVASLERATGEPPQKPA
jgi:hypothetical protein